MHFYRVFIFLYTIADYTELVFLLRILKTAYFIVNIRTGSRINIDLTNHNVANEFYDKDLIRRHLTFSIL